MYKSKNSILTIFFVSGRSLSLRQAAKKYGVPPSTLYGVFMSRGKYIGSGNHSKVFTEEEEQDIARIALEKKDDGKDLTWSNLKEIMIEEMEIIKLKDPSRDMCKVSSTPGSLLNSSFVRRFAERNGLSKYLLKKFTVPTRPHQCQQCGDTFSYKNVLVKHIKTQHTYKHEKFTDPIIPNECPMCGALFNFKIELLKHVRTEQKCYE